MEALTPLFWLAFVFLGIQLPVLVTNLFLFPVLCPAPMGRPERVSILVPVRDELANLPATLPRLLSQGAAEVLVLDDDSSDGTGAFLADLARKAPGLRVLRGGDLPAGWTGKNWACHQLAQEATGEVLVFTDADVRWEPGTLSALLELRGRRQAEYLSVWPRQQVGTLGERLVVPLIDLLLLAALPYLGVRWLPAASLSAGNGQLMLWTRRGYQQVGGHAAVRGEVLEDVRMGQRAKGVGLKLELALGGKLLSTRMYRGYHEVRQGFAKNILAAAGSSRLGLLLLMLLNTLAYSLSWPLAGLDRRWLLVAVLGLVMRGLTALKTSRSAWEAFLQPLAPPALWPVALEALRRDGSYRWKGRQYS